MNRNQHQRARAGGWRWRIAGLLAAGLAAVVAPAAERLERTPAPATITTNALGAGTRFATEYYVHDSGVPGPTVMMVGGAHGNEPAGAHAVETIRHWPLRAGQLVMLPRANVPALEANRRLTPGVATNLANLNRNYPRAGEANPPRGELAPLIWNVALTHHPDWLLDLHEGFDFHQLNENSVGSSIIVFPDDRGPAAADLMLAAVNATISRPELQFVRHNLPINGSLARAGGEHLRIPSMTLETTMKQPLAKRVRQHEIMVHALLSHLEMVSPVLPPESFVEPADPALTFTANSLTPDHLRIALYRGPGTGGQGPPSLMQRLNNPPTSTITQVSPEEIAAGALTNYHVVIFGGGSGSKQAGALGDTGREAVREFVANGGGYVGICAGAYLATSGYSWSLGLVNARTVSPKWRRGRGPVQLEQTEQGHAILGPRPGQFECRYANGPIVAPDDQPELPPFETLAWFRSELAENDTPVGVMINSPAIIAGQFQQGRVVCVSPHPEQSAGLEDLLPRAIQWVATPRTGTGQPTTRNAQ